MVSIANHLVNEHLLLSELPATASIALPLLMRKLELQDSLRLHRKQYYEGSGARKWVRAKKSFISAVLREQGQLSCCYCGKKNLKPRGKPNRCDKNTATIDHWIPANQPNIDPFDSSNWVIACSECNNAKGDQMPFEFMGIEI